MAHSSPSQVDFLSGYPTSICDDVIEDKYLCSRCNNILKNAQQTSCGHRYCADCLLYMVSNQNKAACPKCQTGEADPSSLPSCSLLSVQESFNDAAINREISKFKVHCPSQGCKWNGTLLNYDAHGNICEFALIQCPIGCHLKITRWQLPEHLESECQKNKACFRCFQSMPIYELPTHKCGKASPGTQSLKKTENPTPKKKNGKEKCNYYLIGCAYQGTKEKVKEHERSSVASHLALLFTVISEVKSRGLSGEREDPVSLKSTRSSPSFPNGDVDMSDGANATALSSGGQQEAEMGEKVRVIENIICVLNRELSNLHTELVATREQTFAQEAVIRSLEQKVSILTRTLAMKETEINQLDRRIDSLSHETNDGVFLWRIENVAQKRQDAITGTATSLYSPAFNLAKYGYKACLRIYLNGDGAGKGTHISLFFAVIKGDYDALLTWPFRHKVTFTLLDQNTGEDQFDAFLPDTTSASFQRPIMDMNIASGCPLFCPLTKLQSSTNHYVKEDTMFIRCTIDTSS